MSPTIRVDDEVYEYLKDQAEAFIDTPNSVLRRLFNLGESVQEAATELERPTPKGVAATALKKSGHSRTSGGRRGNEVRGQRRKSGRPKRSRAASSDVLAQDAYVQPLLEALLVKGGSAPAREVIEAVGDKLREHFKPADLEPISSGMIRWQNRTQFVRLRLAEQGAIAKDSPRGVWALTDLGRTRAQQAIAG